jgi:hypothetical protein
MFLANLRRGDSVIAAMAREFLQMGLTRARRAVRQLQRQPEIRPGRALLGCQKPGAGLARLRLCGGLGRGACRPMAGDAERTAPPWRAGILPGSTGGRLNTGNSLKPGTVRVGRIDRSVECRLQSIMSQAKNLLRRRNLRVADDRPLTANPWSKETRRSRLFEMKSLSNRRCKEIPR